MDMEDKRIAELTERARELGREAGEAAGSWAADGNTDADHARRMLAMLDAGDPEVYDLLPATPDLSGEWADGMTPTRLLRELDPEGELGEFDAGEVLQAWEDAASEATQREAERVLRIAAGESGPCPVCGAEGSDESCIEGGRLVDDHAERGGFDAEPVPGPLRIGKPMRPTGVCPDCGKRITLQPTGWWTHDSHHGACWRASMDGPDTDDVPPRGAGWWPGSDA